MTLTAPSFDLDLSDPDEQMKVTNNGTKPIQWRGFRRTYVLEPGKFDWLPFHVIVRYLGDPRSEFRKTEVFQTPSGEKGVIPERRAELTRLSVLYGLYQGKIAQLSKHAPKVTVTTRNDIKIDFPIFNSESVNYRYQTVETRMVDARQEFERMQRQINDMMKRQALMQDAMEADDPEGGEATEDSHPGT